MKAILPLAFIAALAAFLIFPISFEVAGAVLFAAGFTSIAVRDYSRRVRPLRVPARAAVTVPRNERLGLAA